VSSVLDEQQWIAALREPGPDHADAVARLHALLVRAARFELGRRRAALAHVSAGELDDLAMQAAGDALMAVLAKLDTFRGESRFTTWVYKFALLEAGVRLRRRAWQGRELPLTAGEHAAAGPTAHEHAEQAELLAAVRAAIGTALTDHQRRVFTALALDGVPVDVLAERLGTTRGALYKTLHDARRRLRTALAEGGHEIGSTR
jgi:RNA polymerase sigma-70 factor (ECF subfamily)